MNRNIQGVWNSNNSGNSQGAGKRSGVNQSGVIIHHDGGNVKNNGWGRRPPHGPSGSDTNTVKK